MQEIYTISTSNKPIYKRLICGRLPDVTVLLDHLSSGHTVALFGERRIGKTSILFLIQDIITADIKKYASQLLDRDLSQSLPSLVSKLSGATCIYVDCSPIESDRRGLVSVLQRRLELQVAGMRLRVGPHHRNPGSLIEVFEALQVRLRAGQRFIFLLDEVDKLLAFKRSRDIFESLRAVVQSVPQIMFILAGAELWHKEIKERSSPLINNVESFHVRAAEELAIRNYLVVAPLRAYLHSTPDFERVVDTVMRWSGAKPWYVQATCKALVHIAVAGGLPDDWEPVVEKAATVSVKPTLRAFYQGRNIEAVPRKLLALLANKPNQTVKDLAQRLGISEKLVAAEMDDLTDLDKVRRTDERYRITGTLVERWGESFLEMPDRVRPPNRRIKWAAAAGLVISALVIYFYTHPPLETFFYAFPAGMVAVQMPSSLESHESGTAIVTVQNTSNAPVKMLSLSLMSDDITYQHDGSNRCSFENISPNEKKSVEEKFVSDSTRASAAFSSQLALENTSANFSRIYPPFEIHRRGVPLKHYWGIVSVLALGIASFLNKRDVSQLLSSIFPSLIQPETPDAKKEAPEQEKENEGKAE